MIQLALFAPTATPTAVRPLRDLRSLKPASRPWTAPTAPPVLDGVKRVSIDVERKDPGLDELGPGTFRGTSRVCGLALGTDDGRRFYFPTSHEGGGNCEWDVIGWTRDWTRRFTGEVVGARIGYDLEALRGEWNATFPLAVAFHDVQVAEAVLDEWRFSYSLESLARDYLKEGKAQGRLEEIAALHKWTSQKDVKSNIYRLHAADVGEYGEGDADLPLRIIDLQLKKLEADGQLDVYRLERELIPIVLDMRFRGVRVAPTSRIESVRARFLRERDRWAEEVKRLLGPKAELNASSSLGAGLAARGVPVPKTKKGTWSVTKELLEKYKGDAAIDAIAAGRRVGTLVSLTLDSMLEHVARDGRIHCEFDTLKGEDDTGRKRGTIARFSCAYPNTQQIPSRQSEFDELLFVDDAESFDVSREIRGLFLPDDGEDWHSSDESQVEYRLLVDCAVGAGAEEARERYRSDPSTDYHKFTAALLNVDPEDGKKRKRVKNTNFAYGYGAKERKLATTFNCSVEEATRFVREYERKCPFVKATYEKASRIAARDGVVHTILGRKCRFPLWEPRGNFGDDKLPAYPLERARIEYPGRPLVRANAYKALNRKLQGSGADIIKKAMVDAHRAGLNEPGALGAFLLTVHDELDASVPKTARGREAAVELVRIMETCVEDRMRVPLSVKTEVGPSWGEAK